MGRQQQRRTRQFSDTELKRANIRAVTEMRGVVQQALADDPEHVGARVIETFYQLNTAASELFLAGDPLAAFQARRLTRDAFAAIEQMLDVFVDARTADLTAEVARLSEQLTMLSAPFPELEDTEMTAITLDTKLEAVSLWRWLTDAGYQPTRNGHRIAVEAPASAVEDWRATLPTAEAQKAQLRAALNPDILAKVKVAA